ncbi:GT4 family glycosyltransferase PelF [Thalassospira marina]|uniref:Glycosyl transferase, group 1 n=1 Tax=Thalassospira marina TaxID=2048283 RepID=A0ABN5F9M8_9PROT|nr:GT4 family glycosyltransferase PelF [Thalassospira marina]AUG51447.1 glycosyl transferase, group 1 [Thalassospira marina]
MNSPATREADICLLLEGTYPYVAGGVSSWVHDIVSAMPDITFEIVAILAQNTGEFVHKYKVPDNVIGIRHLYLHELPDGRNFIWQKRKLRDTTRALLNFLNSGDINDFTTFTRGVNGLNIGKDILLNSHFGWEFLKTFYAENFSSTSFLDFFWSWRILVGGILATTRFKLPKARCYHAVSTGYAGVLAARAKIEYQRPVVLTEHGIYTNERRIEIAMADWLYQNPIPDYDIKSLEKDIRSLWLKGFSALSKACYAACDEIITLYEGNQVLQLRDGAAPEKVRVIPNGIDYDKYSAVARDRQEKPVIGLIGRVVPIKDIKSFIRAIHMLTRETRNFEALILGPTDEDETYFEECQEMVEHLGIKDVVIFGGRVNIADYLGKIDVLVLSSVSEAQPLVILEGGAAGIPTVATDVGACREMLYGRSDENPPLGQGGIVVPVANPSEMAKALAQIITSPSTRDGFGETIRKRVAAQYNKKSVLGLYDEIYKTGRDAPDGYNGPLIRSEGKN